MSINLLKTNKIVIKYYEKQVGEDTRLLCSPCLLFLFFLSHFN